MKISIAYAPDDKYVNQTVVSIVSALENNRAHDVEIIIMYSALSADSMKKLRDTGAKLRFIKMDESRFASLPLSYWVTVQAWFRILLPDMCDDLDKILYLDCDTMVLGDLGELFGTNLDNKYLAGVKDIWGTNRSAERLGMQTTSYLNSGMLLLNCKYCRENSFFDKIVDFAQNNAKIIKFCDQDSINKIVDENKLVISPKYNFMDPWWRNGYYEYSGEYEKEYLEAFTNAVIVHFTGPKPAFKGCKNSYKDVWQEYAKRTTIYDELKTDYENSKEPAPDLSFKDKVFSIKNEYSGKTKTKYLRAFGLKIKIGKTLTPDDIDRKYRKREHRKLSKIKFDVPPYYAEDYDKKTDIDLITISFNNPKVVEYQIKLIRKFVNGNYRQIICDNSNVKEKSESIRNVCEKLGVTFIRITASQNPNGYSDSHGIALNWVYQNIVKKRQNNFAFLDHDIMPVSPVNIDTYLKDQDFYGTYGCPHKRYILNKDMWYLWPGYCFYRYDVLKNRKINFGKWRRFGFLKVKVVGADTGSANWPVLYSKYDSKKLKYAKSFHWNIRTNSPVKPEDIRALAQTDLVQYFDNKSWLHVIDGSEWQDSHGKTEIVYKLFDEILNA